MGSSMGSSIKVMDTPDTLEIILSYRMLSDNVNNSDITKYIHEISKDVIKNQINLRRLFIRFKNRTVFPPIRYTRPIRTYYTLKNRYIDRDETPILLF